MSKVFVTGGAGFVGSHLVKKLCDEGHHVTIYDSFQQYIFPVDDNYVNNIRYRAEKLTQEARTLRGNTLNKDDLRRTLLQEKPDYIVHFAALPLANLAIHQSEEAFDSILRGTVNILEVLRDVDFVSKLVYISSSMVYGDFVADPQPEDAPTQPKDVYGALKLSGEILVRTYAQRYGVTYAIVRPSAVYGPSDNNRRVLQIFLENAMQGKPLTVKNGQRTFLDFSYVEDTAEGIKRVTLSPQANGETFNITRGQGRSLMEAVAIIREHFPQLEVAASDEETFHPKRGAMDTRKAQDLVGYRPCFDLEQGIARYVEFLHNHYRR